MNVIVGRGGVLTVFIALFSILVTVTVRLTVYALAAVALLAILTYTYSKRLYSAARIALQHDHERQQISKGEGPRVVKSRVI